MASKANRPSPTDSATWYEPGSIMTGNDGNLYIVKENAQGVQRWVLSTNQYLNNNPTKVMSKRHPSYSSKQPSYSHLPFKFKVGDKVKITFSGSGCGPEHIGDTVTISEIGNYGGRPGYKVIPAIGNCLSGYFNGFIGEETFEIYTPTPTVTSQQINKLKTKTTNMSRTKSITKRSTKEVRNIETSLINKEEVFRMLALAESTGLPLLLMGQPGVAKTKTVIEYAKAWLNKDGKMTAQDFTSKVYILETDEGTKASEIKGMPDLGKLFENNKYELNAPIAEADIVIINEVDKASAAIRNAMLGVMNEKFLFNGKHKIPCKWKLFVATCNEIPKDEVKSPFWDRFMLKMEVNRVSAGELVKYYNKGARNYKESFKIGVPDKQELQNIEIPNKKLEKYLEVGYSSSSDRTLTFVPTLAKAVSFIWDNSIDKALVKTAQIMIGTAAGSELQNKLFTPEYKAITSKIDMIKSHSTNEQLELAIAEIESLINTYTSRGVLDQTDVEELETLIQVALHSHPARAEYVSSEEFDTMLDD